MKHAALILFFLLIAGCVSQPPDASFTVLSPRNLPAYCSKQYNLVFIYTTWCGVTPGLLRRTYRQLLADTTLRGVNILLVCGDDDYEAINRLYTGNGIRAPKYVLERTGLTDRDNIRHFIRNAFRHTEDVRLDGLFGVPLTLLVDSTQTVIDPQFPQRPEDIRRALQQLGVHS